MKVYGNPGDYASELAINARIKQGLAAVGVAVLLPATLAAIFWLNMPAVLAIGMALACLLIGFTVASSAGRQHGKARVGATKEEETANLLAKSGLAGVAVFGLQLGRYRGSKEDCDVLVALDAGPVFTLEVKTGYGALKVLPGGQLQVGKRVIPGNPAAQAKRAHDDLEHTLKGVQSTPLVVVSDAYGSPRHSQGVEIIPAKTLIATMRPTVSGPSYVASVEALARKQHKRAYRVRKTS